MKKNHNFRFKVQQKKEEKNEKPIIISIDKSLKRYNT